MLITYQILTLLKWDLHYVKILSIFEDNIKQLKQFKHRNNSANDNITTYLSVYN